MVKIICSNYLLYALMGVFVLGVLSRLVLVAAYNGLRRSTYNMAGSNNRLIKQVKLKYESYDKLEFPVTNAVAFTKKAMYEYRICGMSLRFLEKFLGQAMFWCVVIGVTAVGCGYFFDIPTDTMVLYGVSAVLFSVLLYNIDKVSDIDYARENIEICIVDYLENHVRERLQEKAVETQAIDEPEDMGEEALGNAVKVAVEEADKEKKVTDDNRIIEEVLNEIFC